MPARKKQKNLSNNINPWNYKQTDKKNSTSKCPVCDKKFKTSYGLRRHIGEKHKSFSSPLVLEKINPPQKRKPSKLKQVQKRVYKTFNKKKKKINKKHQNTTGIGGRKKGISQIKRTKANKLRRTAQYMDLDTKTSRNQFLEDQKIPASDMDRWVNNFDKWLRETDQNLRKCFSRPTIKGFGQFHEQEIQVYRQYSDYRAQGYVVQTQMLARWMMAACVRDQPPKFKPGYHKWGNGWQARFCKRWKISRQKKTKKKTEDVFMRLHEINNYHYFTLYLWQDPDNYQDPYFSEANYVDRHPADLIDRESETSIEGSSTPSLSDSD